MHIYRTNVVQKTLAFAASSFVAYLWLWTIYKTLPLFIEFLFENPVVPSVLYSDHLRLLLSIIVGGGLVMYDAKWAKPGFMKTLLVAGPVAFAVSVHIASAIWSVIAYELFISGSGNSDESALIIIIPCIIITGAGFALYAAKKAPWPSVRYATTRISIALILSLVAFSHMFMHSLRPSIFTIMGLSEASIVTLFIGAAGCALFLFNKTPFQYLVFCPPAFVAIALIYWYAYFFPYMPY